MILEKAFLKVKDCGKGLFSSERILEAKDYEGKRMEGFFDKDNIIKGRLEVTLAKDYRDSVSVITPQYFINQTLFIVVDKKNLIYEKHL